MTDNKLDGLNNLVELVRLSTPGSRKAGDSKSVRPRPGRQTPDAVPPLIRRGDIGQLRSRLADRLQRQESKELSSSQVSKLVVREILLWEFGPQLEEHVEFGAMMDTIERAFASNPALQGKISALLDELTKEGKPKP